MMTRRTTKFLNFVTLDQQIGLLAICVAAVMLFLTPTIVLSNTPEQILRLEKLTIFEFHGVEDKRDTACVWTLSSVRMPPTGRVFRDLRLSIPSGDVDLRLRYQGASQEIEALSSNDRMSRYELIAYDLKNTKYSIIVSSRPQQPTTINRVEIYNVSGLVGAKKLVADCDKIKLIERPKG